MTGRLYRTRISLCAALFIWIGIVMSPFTANAGVFKNEGDYRERMALPPGAIVEVMLMQARPDGSAQLIAATQRPASSRGER